MLRKKRRSGNRSRPAKVDVYDAAPVKNEDGKNPAAVALGRLGGKKGGLARAKKLSKTRRQEIARRAAQARWGKNPKNKRTG